MKILLLFVFLASLGISSAQNEWITHTYAQQVNALADDGNYLWLGTEGGLIKMKKSNGHREMFTKVNSPLPDNRIKSLYLDDKDDLWIGTGDFYSGGNVARLSKQTWTVYNTPADSLLPEAEITTIDRDPQGRMCFGSKYSDMVFFDGTNWSKANSPYQNTGTADFTAGGSALWAIGEFGHFANFNGSAWSEAEDLRQRFGFNTLSYCIYVTSDNRVLIGSREGLLCFDNGIWTKFDSTNTPLRNPWVTNITEDKHGNIWLSCDHPRSSVKYSSVAKYDGNTWTIFDHSNSTLPDDNWLSLIADKKGDIWLGSAENGLFHYDGTTWTGYSSSGLPSKRVGSVGEDLDGNIWFSSFDNKGAARFDGSQWSYYNSSNSPLDSYAYTKVYGDNSGRVWIAGVTGLYMHDGTNWTKYTRAQHGIPGDSIWNINADAHGNIWIAAMGGVAKFDGTDWTSYTKQSSGFPFQSAENVAVDAAGNIWAGSYEGLLKYDGSQWQLYTVADGLPDNLIGALVIKGNTIWAGTGKGLAKFDGTNWTSYTTQNSPLPGERVTSLAFDGAIMWIGTNGGVAKFDGTDWLIFNGDNSPLPSNFVTGLFVDSQKRKWISTTAGIAVYREGGVFLFANNEATGVEESGAFSASPASMHVYPNPASHTATLSVDIPEEYIGRDAKLRIFDGLGSLRAEISLGSDARLHLDLSAFADGIYHAELSTAGRRAAASFSVIR